ncbi:MAG: phosphoribosylamine--glycine ligase [Gaiellaceae bacterium]
MKVLVVGSGGREHALAWKLSQSPELTELHAAPGNPGIAQLGTCHPVRPEDADSLLGLCREHSFDLVVVGPEVPLVVGVADHLRHAGCSVFGPSAAAARIEGSKSFAKDVMASAEVPAAKPLAIARPPCVVKVDGLAAGKGVFVCRTEQELEAGLVSASAYGGPIVIEELLQGEEVSVFALSDGRTAVPLAAARDYKQIDDGDRGPNTGGMGSFAPVSEVDLEELVERVHRPVLAELAQRGTPFVGVLFAGLMLTQDGPRVLEFNCRLGDPEAQAILPLLEGDVLEAFAAAAAGHVGSASLSIGDRGAVTVVLAGRDYPDRPDTGTPIEGVAEAEALGALVFHAGTAVQGDRLVTSGGRILNVTAVGESVPDARTRAYEAVGRISFDGMRHRRDIAAKAEHVRA